MELSTLTRRDFFRSLAAAPLATAWPTWMPRLAFAPQQTAPRGDVLLVIFLRGAADVLNMVVPFGEEAYYQARPTLAIPRPDQLVAGSGLQAVDLDGFFGFHPALAPLKTAWDEKHLGLIHACGAPDISRSHFKAMALMERGVEDERGPASGWINRHLATYNTGNNSPIRAIGLGPVLPQSLYGEVPATAMRSIVDFHLNGDDRLGQHLYRMLRGLYSQESDIGQVGRETLDVIDILSKLDPAQYLPADGAFYPDSTFGYNLRQAAMLIKADAGLEVAAIDLGGWDTHFGQGGSQGLMAGLLNDLASGLAAFHADMIDHLDLVTIVVMSEFGRRVKENASLGTDHGHGSLMMVMGGHVNGGQVLGQWPGLEIEQLFGPGDLAVTTDYRDVLGEIIKHRLKNEALEQIFPEYQWQGVGAVSGDQ